jgi:hypothetical protein
LVSNVDVTNQALAEIGSRSQITSMTDGSPEALYANLLYVPLRDFMLREGDYDFALKSPLIGASTVASTPWIYAYTLPTDCIRIRQLVPQVYDALSPLPIEWNLDNGLIVTKMAVSVIIYTYAASENAWDSMFHEAFVRMLGSALTFALQNRAEVSREFLQQAMQFATAANMRDL